MTSTALLLLSLALVWSIVGTALEPKFDHGTSSVMTSILKKHEIIHDNYQNMKTLRTKDSYRHFNSLHKDKVIHNVDTNRINEDDTRQVKYDKLYTARDDSKEQVYNLELHKAHVESRNRENLSNNIREVNYRTKGSTREYNFKKSNHNAVIRRAKREEEDKCENFNFSPDKKHLSHPGNRSGVYYSSVDCTTTIEGQDGKVIQLTFVDMFHIEDHPDCAYDYLEIRDGRFGYAHSLGKFCGAAFPSQIRSTGPFVWMKFFSDDTIEYEGFHISVEYIESPGSHQIPSECYIEQKSLMVGYLSTFDAQFENCKSKTKDLNQALDVLWNITAPGDSENSAKYRIYLNFTSYQLEKTNECEENVIQVFGSVLEYPKKLAHYCGSMANPVTTREDAEGNDKGNVMYVRLYASKSALNSQFNATFTVIRTLNPNNDEKCDENTEFDCEDNTCIAKELRCNNYANCRLKADEDVDNCKKEAQSVLTEPHILTILVIFSLILSGMSFVFLFKCMRKLYQDHTIIKEHIRQSCEDRLDSLVSSRLTLDAKRLQRDSEPRASLERENHTNEMFKRQRNFSQNKPTSIDSDYIQETHLDLDDEHWRRDVENVPVETEEVRIERNGRHRRSESKKEPSRKESKSIKEVSEEDNRSRKEIRDVSVGAPDTKESGCQTRESLFQDVSSPEGTESGSGSRGFSTFGYSGATIVRPSPPAPATQTTQMTVELLRTMPSRQESQTKKLPDRRPMSTETTRSAPDVIIVSKPIR